MSNRTFNRRIAGSTAIAAALGAAVYFLPRGTVLGEEVAGPLAQATAVSPQPTSTSPQPQPTPRQVRFFPVDPLFTEYYNTHDGPRVLGSAISPRTTSGGQAAQYFEKARLEDRRSVNRTGNAAYDFEYGLLVDEMKAVRSLAPVGGDRSNVTYDTIETQSDAARRVAPPAGFTGNFALFQDGSAFVPFTADLSSAPGHVIPPYFWDFMNQMDLFPAGWLHDIGLPITEVLDAVVDKGRFLPDLQRFTNVPIKIQAFQRTILTYDPANPAGFTVERANTGTDFMAVFPDRVPQ